MVFVLFVVGLLNIYSQHHNYGIKIEDPNFDIRVRRSIEDAVKPEIFNIRNNLENVLKTDVLKSDVLKREKRHAYYKQTGITNNDLLKYNSNNKSESQTLKNRYDIFNPNYNFLFNTTRKNQNNNTGVKNGITINRRPLSRSYPYRDAPGYEPRPTRAIGYNIVTSTPVYYNYQNPNGPNFAGYVGYTANKPGYEYVTPGYEYVTPGYKRVTPGYKRVAVGYKSVTPGYNSVTSGYNSVTPGYYKQYERRNAPSTNNNYPSNRAFAPYPPNYSQNPINNNFPTTNNSGIYNNNFNNIPVPYKDNGTTASNNTHMPYISATNTSVTPGQDYIFPSINDYNLPYNNTVSPNNNNVSPTTNNNVSPTNNNNVFPTNNTNVTPSNINTTVTTTSRTLSGCIICNIPCPQFMKRYAWGCMQENNGDDDY